MAPLLLDIEDDDMEDLDDVVFGPAWAHEQNELAINLGIVKENINHETGVCSDAARLTEEVYLKTGGVPGGLSGMVASYHAALNTSHQMLDACRQTMQETQQALAASQSQNRQLSAALDMLNTIVNTLTKKIDTMAGKLDAFAVSRPATAPTELRPQQTKDVHALGPVIRPKPKQSTPAAPAPSRLVIKMEPKVPRAEQKDATLLVAAMNSALPTGDTAVKVIAATWNAASNIIAVTNDKHKADDLLPYKDAIRAAIGPEATSAVTDQKWNKLCIDGTPLRFPGTAKTERYTTDKIHEDLMSRSPAYAEAVKAGAVVMKPRWVRSLEDTMDLSRSSCVFALNNKERATRLLKETKVLPVFGHFGKLRLWMDRNSAQQCTSCWGLGHHRMECKEGTACRRCGGEHVETECVASSRCEQCVGGVDVDMSDVCVHALKCPNCARAGKADLHHATNSKDCPIRRKEYSTMQDNVRRQMKSAQPFTVVKKKAAARKPRTVAASKLTPASNPFTPLISMGVNGSQAEPIPDPLLNA